MKTKELSGTIKTFIDQHHIMNLAVSDGSDIWAASVYYIFYNRMFYFFSKKDARHILYAQTLGMAAASIHGCPTIHRQIKGIQCKGPVEKAPTDTVSTAAFAMYAKKFSLAGDFASLDTIKKLYRSSWYRLCPETLVYMDNAVRLGNKTEIILASPKKGMRHDIHNP